MVWILNSIKLVLCNQFYIQYFCNVAYLILNTYILITYFKLITYLFIYNFPFNHVKTLICFHDFCLEANPEVPASQRVQMASRHLVSCDTRMRRVQSARVCVCNDRPYIYYYYYYYCYIMN